MTAAPEPLTRYTAAKVARMRGLCTETVLLRCRLDENGQSTWPHHRDGRRIYFTDADLAAIDDLAAVPARPRPTAGRTAGSAAYHRTPAPSTGRKSRIR